jgi:SAM-dependent methyltransferase
LRQKLGIADLVATGPKTSNELALATKTHGPTLYRFLRALTSLGLFSADSAGGFRNTQLSDALRTDHPESIRPWALMLGAPFFWKPMGELHQAITTGQPAFDQVYGDSFFRYLAGHPGDAAVFDGAMTAGSSSVVTPLLAAYDFSRFTRIVDIGGGHGALLEAILTANPNLQGVLYDLPGVVAGADRLRTGNVAGRCEILGGDFFQGVPANADAYLLKGIIHDWDDNDAVKILKNCRRSIHPEGRLLLLETVLNPSSEPAKGLMDMLMLTLVGGRERTEPDFRALLQRAGFSLSRVIQTSGPDIIESLPSPFD